MKKTLYAIAIATTVITSSTTVALAMDNSSYQNTNDIAITIPAEKAEEENKKPEEKKPTVNETEEKKVDEKESEEKKPTINETEEKKEEPKAKGFFRKNKECPDKNGKCEEKQPKEEKKTN